MDELSNRVLEHYGYKKEEINPNIKIGTGRIREQSPQEILQKISKCQGMLENERFRFIVEYDPEYEHFLTLVDYPLRYVQPSGNDKQSTGDGESRKA